MGKNVCCFSWSKKKINVEELKQKLKKEIKKLVTSFDVTEFYVCSNNAFDALCTECVKEIKHAYPRVRLCLVLPNFSEKIKSEQLFDEIIHLNFEKISSQVLQLSLFDWLIDKSDFLISITDEEHPQITIRNLADKDMLIFATRIKLLRLKQGISQAELAKSIGVAVSTIGMYEQGRREPDFPTFLKLCIELKTTTDYVLGIDKKFKPKLIEIEEFLSDFTRKIKKNNKLLCDGRHVNREGRECLEVSFFTALEVTKKFLIKKAELKIKD